MPNNIKEVVNDPEWQHIRESMVGTWNLIGDDNCKRLRWYLDDFSDPLKLRRVHNYLTGSGFRSGRIKCDEVDQLLKEIRWTITKRCIQI